MIGTIDSITVWNRTDCCQSRLSNLYVSVSDTPFSSNGVSATLAQSGVSAYYHAGEAGTSVPFTIGRTGRYVRVQLTGINYLSLAEVAVATGTGGAAITGPRRAEPEARLSDQCASLSSDICFALAAAAKLYDMDALTIRSDDGGGSALGVSAAAAGTAVSTMSADPRRYSYYSLEMTLLAETEHTTDASPPVQYEYVWFAGVPVAQVSNSVPSEPLATPEVVWPVTDHLGTPKLQTDANQQIVWHAEHEPYRQIYVL